jgi:hypothetical protein
MQVRDTGQHVPRILASLHGPLDDGRRRWWLDNDDGGWTAGEHPSVGLGEALPLA